MPANRAPTYHHWARERPATTNATYGWTLKLDPRTLSTDQCDKTCRHCTEDQTKMAARSSADVYNGSQYKKERCEICQLPSSINGFNINKGYVTGYVSVQDKMASKRKECSKSKKRMSKGDDTEAGEQSDEVVLWHSVSGTIVRCPDYKSSAQKSVELY